MTEPKQSSDRVYFKGAAPGTEGPTPAVVDVLRVLPKGTALQFPDGSEITLTDEAWLFIHPETAQLHVAHPVRFAQLVEDPDSGEEGTA